MTRLTAPALQAHTGAPAEELINLFRLGVLFAIQVPLRVMETALASLEPNKAMADIGNPASGPDAGVGALCARPAVMGEFLNARINCAGLKDKAYVRELVARGQEIERQAHELERTILAIVQAKL